MGIFTSYVGSSDHTRIFASRDGESQVLAYETSYASDGQTALVIPVPVPVGSGNAAVEPVDLSGYKDFFKDLDRTFPRNSRRDKAPRLKPALGQSEVSSFNFVPTLAGLNGLDPRFRLAPALWKYFPLYADWGFVVVTLPDTLGNVHGVAPFAFKFKSRFQDGFIFFPTVSVTEYAYRSPVKVDTELYYQKPQKSAIDDFTSAHRLDESMDYTRAQRLIAKDSVAFKRHQCGFQPNIDCIF